MVATIESGPAPADSDESQGSNVYRELGDDLASEGSAEPRVYPEGTPDWLKVHPEESNGDTTENPEPKPDTDFKGAYDPNLNPSGRESMSIAERDIQKHIAELRAEGKTGEAQDLENISVHVGERADEAHEALEPLVKEVEDKAAQADNRVRQFEQGSDQSAPLGYGRAGEAIQARNQERAAQVQAETAAQIQDVKDKNYDAALNAGAEYGKTLQKSYEMTNDTVARLVSTTVDKVRNGEPDVVIQPLRTVDAEMSSDIRTGLFKQLNVTGERAMPRAVREVKLPNKSTVLERYYEAGTSPIPGQRVRIVERIDPGTEKVISLTTVISPEPTTVTKKRFGFFGAKRQVINPALTQFVDSRIADRDVKDGQSGEYNFDSSPLKNYSDVYEMSYNRMRMDGVSEGSAKARRDLLKKQQRGFWSFFFTG